jgi:hypothetical protein
MITAPGKKVDNNLIDLHVGLNSGLKQDYGSKTRERKNSDTKDCSFDVVSALPLDAMLSHQSICIPLNRLAVSSCKNIRIGRARVIKEKCLK